jgi:hypothetical protein
MRGHRFQPVTRVGAYGNGIIMGPWLRGTMQSYRAEADGRMSTLFLTSLAFRHYGIKPGRNEMTCVSRLTATRKPSQEDQEAFHTRKWTPLVRSPTTT